MRIAEPPLVEPTRDCVGSTLDRCSLGMYRDFHTYHIVILSRIKGEVGVGIDPAPRHAAEYINGAEDIVDSVSVPSGKTPRAAALISSVDRAQAKVRQTHPG